MPYTAKTKTKQNKTNKQNQPKPKNQKPALGNQGGDTEWASGREGQAIVS